MEGGKKGRGLGVGKWGRLSDKRERDGGGENVLKVGKQPSPFFTPLTFPTLHTYEGRRLLPLNNVALRCHS